jgi:hypothetical protein
VSLVGVFLLALTGAAHGQGLTNPLTPDQVSCDELQLERLEKRFVVIQRDPLAPFTAENPSLFLWRSSSAGGTFSGLGVTNSLRGDASGHLGRDEEQLAFDLFARQFGDRLNPRRPLIPQATLARRGQDSNLIAPGNAPSLTVSLDLVGQPVADPYAPAVPLAVNSLSSPGQGDQPLAAADAVGHGVAFDGLADACHAQFTPMDEKIFGILARTVRLSLCLTERGCFADPTAYNVTLFRGAGAQTYRANIYPYVKTCPNAGPCQYSQFGKVALEFTINWNGDGSLTSGAVTVLPACPAGPAPGCSDATAGGVVVYFLPPLFAGHEKQGQEVIAAAPHLDIESPGDPHNILSATVDWQALLANSAWN